MGAACTTSAISLASAVVVGAGTAAGSLVQDQAVILWLRRDHFLGLIRENLRQRMARESIEDSRAG
jgi:hypothetical protein